MNIFIVIVVVYLVMVLSLSPTRAQECSTLFVTSETYSMDIINGYENANEICRARAEASNYAHIKATASQFFALLSSLNEDQSNAVHPLTRMSPLSRCLKTPTGRLLAESLHDVTGLASLPNETEIEGVLCDGGAAERGVWTGFDAQLRSLAVLNATDIQVASSDNIDATQFCSSLTAVDDQSRMVIGRCNFGDERWAHHDVRDCAVTRMYRLYCVSATPCAAMVWRDTTQILSNRLRVERSLVGVGNAVAAPNFVGIEFPFVPQHEWLLANSMAAGANIDGWRNYVAMLWSFETEAGESVTADVTITLSGADYVLEMRDFVSVVGINKQREVVMPSIEVGAAMTVDGAFALLDDSRNSLRDILQNVGVEAMPFTVPMVYSNTFLANTMALVNVDHHVTFSFDPPLRGFLVLLGGDGTMASGTNGVVIVDCSICFTPESASATPTTMRPATGGTDSGNGSEQGTLSLSATSATTASEAATSADALVDNNTLATPTIALFVVAAVLFVVIVVVCALLCWRRQQLRAVPGAGQENENAGDVRMASMGRRSQVRARRNTSHGGTRPGTRPSSRVHQVKRSRSNTDERAIQTQYNQPHEQYGTLSLSPAPMAAYASAVYASTPESPRQQPDFYTHVPSSVMRRQPTVVHVGTYATPNYTTTNYANAPTRLGTPSMVPPPEEYSVLTLRSRT